MSSVVFYPLEGPRRPISASNKPISSARRVQLLREAIIVAAEEVGADGAGMDGLVGYLKQLAMKEPKSFASLLGRVLPLQLTAPANPTSFLELDPSVFEGASAEELAVMERVFNRAARRTATDVDGDADQFAQIIEGRST